MDDNDTNHSYHKRGRYDEDDRDNTTYTKPSYDRPDRSHSFDGSRHPSNRRGEGQFRSHRGDRQQQMQQSPVSALPYFDYNPAIMLPYTMEPFPGGPGPGNNHILLIQYLYLLN